MVMEERRNLYGGKRGLQDKGSAINTLRLFAKSDFKHDFGENVDSRDKYTNDDQGRFLEICQKYGLSKVKAIRAGFDKVIGSNPYQNYKDILPAQIFPDAGTDADYQIEEKILEDVGINYKTLKNEIATYKNKLTNINYLNNPYKKAEPLTITTSDGSRQYQVTAGPLKVDGETPNIASLFNRVSGGNQNFALIIDAAGGLSMTALQDAKLQPHEPEKEYKFYIIENIENDSDSATKLKNFDKSSVPTNVQIMFLKDTAQSIVYEAFDKEALRLDSHTEALFGNAKLVLSRNSEDTEADFVYSDTQYHIENVSQNANVKNASLNMLASELGGRGREAFLYAYLKRVGDWCQALSLLDTSREYNALDMTKKKIV
jgi:hypothetical protein